MLVTMDACVAYYKLESSDGARKHGFSCKNAVALRHVNRFLSIYIKVLINITEIMIKCSKRIQAHMYTHRLARMKKKVVKR